MISPNAVQFYDHELQRLEHPWRAKVMKWLERDCIVIVSESEASCLPMSGYNTRNYKMNRIGFDWKCQCQGFHKRGDCSHVQALLLKLRFENRDMKQGALFP